MDKNFFDIQDLKFWLTHPDVREIVKLWEDNFSQHHNFEGAPIDFEDAVDSYERVLLYLDEINRYAVKETLSESVKTQTNKISKLIQIAGLSGMTIPRKYGGLHFPVCVHVLATELIARNSTSFAFYWALQESTDLINRFGTDDIKNDILPELCNNQSIAVAFSEALSGSDLSTVQTRANWDDNKKVWHINGTKKYVVNGNADILLILARTEPEIEGGKGLTLFIHKRSDGGCRIRQINQTVSNCVNVHELIFENAAATLLGSRKLGLYAYISEHMSRARINFSALSLGIAYDAYKKAKIYALHRKLSKKNIVEFPAIYEMLTDSHAKLAASRTFLFETARCYDFYQSLILKNKTSRLNVDERNHLEAIRQKLYLLSPVLKYKTSQFSNEVVADAVSIHGGKGLIKGYPVEDLQHAIKLTTVIAGTDQVQVQLAMKGISNEAFLAIFWEYNTEETPYQCASLKKKLAELTDDYAEAREKVFAFNDKEYEEFHGPRLIDMAGNILMGYLMVNNVARDKNHYQLTEIFIQLIYAENKKNKIYISNFDYKDLGLYRFQSSE